MKKKIFDICILAACILVVVIFLAKGIIGVGSRPVSAEAADAITQTVNATPTPVPERLEASYTGKTLVVGQKFDLSEMVVTVYYSDGRYENVTDYTISSDVVAKSGMNTIVVMYGNLSAKAYVYGKELLSISVNPVKEKYGVGNMPDCKDLTVLAKYNDNSEEFIDDGFSISPEKLDTPGVHEVTVSYYGKEATCEVEALQWTSISAINVAYNKSEILTNSQIKKEDFTVMAVYTDLSTERVTTFTLSREVFYDSGKQPLTITYGGFSRSIELNVVERYVVGLRAEYTGGVVVTGKKYRSDKMHVYLKYVDGEEVETKDYTVHNRKIRYIGNNTITVYYGEKFSADVVIEGVELIKPNFDYASSKSAEVGDLKVTVDTAVPVYLDLDCTSVEPIAKKEMKKAYRRLGLKKGKYIAFEYSFVDEDNELELPLTIRVTIPDGFDMEHTFMYFCPNKKSILGRMNRNVINDRTFECTIFKVGTYMLVYSDELVEDEEI